MLWKVEWDEKALKDAQKLSSSDRNRIIKFLNERIAIDENPRRLGKPLTGKLTDSWRYRVGNIRIICKIEDDKLVVLIIAVGYRNDIYK